MCAKHLRHEPLSVGIFLFKFVRFIEVSSNFMEEKSLRQN